MVIYNFHTLESILKIYEIEYIKNFESNEFIKGFLIFTDLRFVLTNENYLNEKNLVVNDYIKDIFCLIVNYEESNSTDMFIKINRISSTAELIIRSKKKIFKIIKNVSKYYENVTENKLKVFKSVFDEFTNSTCVDYLNLCYDIIQTFKKPVITNYKINDFIKLSILGEGSNGKVNNY